MFIAFANRVAAGRVLATELVHYRSHLDLLVLGLPRGGVPVADQVARALHAELDVIVVRKVGAPWHPELALGAVASGGLFVRNDEFSNDVFDSEEVHEVIAKEIGNVAAREQRYRRGGREARIRNREVILVDDGAATGASMLVAIQAARRLGARRIAIALPVASQSALRRLAVEADDVVCAATPPDFQSVGEWYEDFSAVSDEAVCALLKSGGAAASAAR